MFRRQEHAVAAYKKKDDELKRINYVRDEGCTDLIQGGKTVWPMLRSLMDNEIAHMNVGK